MTNEPVRQMDQMGPEDLVIPELKLIQAMGGQEAKDAGVEVGNFYNPITGIEYPGQTGADMVIVDIGKVRTYWGREVIDDEPPMCSSADGKVNVNGESCDECPYNARCDNPWTLSVSDRKQKCLLSYNVVAISIDSLMPMMIRCAGMSAQSARELITALKTNRTLGGQYHKALVNLSAVKKKTSMGTEVFAMRFKFVKLLADDEAPVQELADMSRQLLGGNLLASPAPEPQARLEPPKTEPAPQPPPAQFAAKPPPPPAQKKAEVIPPKQPKKPETADPGPVLTDYDF